MANATLRLALRTAERGAVRASKAAGRERVRESPVSGWAATHGGRVKDPRPDLLRASHKPFLLDAV